MGTFAVELYSRAFDAMGTGRLALQPVAFSARAWGGPHRAEIAVTGDAQSLWDVLNWLRCYVVIRNGDGNAVWSGIVVEALVGAGAAQVGRSLEGMSNRVAVAYTVEGLEGTERGTTAWAQENGSVGEYGVKELMLSLGDTSAEQATAARDTWLSQRAAPPTSLAVQEGAGATLICAGLWSTLGWRYYVQLAGQEMHDVGADTEHMLGWGLGPTSNKLGFYADKLGDLDCRLGYLVPGNRVTVAGSWANDGDYLVESAGDPDHVYESYASDAIFFEQQDDIFDDLAGFGFVRVGEMIRTTGSAQSENNDTWWVSKINGLGSIEVEQTSIVSETDVGTITLEQGDHAVFEATFTREVISPSQNITLTGLGVKVAQRFQIATATGWTAREAWVQARRVGSPGDNLRIRIYSDSGGNPGTELASGTVAACPSALGWVRAELGSGVALAPATYYWVVVDRTGGVSHLNFYGVGLEGEASYPRGALKIQRAGAGTWSSRDPDGDMPFRLYAADETTSQIRTMIETGEFFRQVTVDVASGVRERLYRNGDLTALEEVERLLGVGTVSGGGLVATVDASRGVRVEAEPVAGDLDWLLTAEGRLRHPLTGREEAGLLPAGRWVRIEGIPGVLGDLSRFLIDEAEYEAGSGRVRLTPRGQE